MCPTWPCYLGACRCASHMRPTGGPTAGRPVWKCLTGSGRWSSGYAQGCTSGAPPPSPHGYDAITFLPCAVEIDCESRAPPPVGARTPLGRRRASGVRAQCTRWSAVRRGHRRSSPPAVRLLLRRRSPADGCDGRRRSCAAWPSRPPGCAIATRPRGRPPRFRRCRGSPPRTAVD